MGVAQRALEAAGFSTVLLSTIPDLTASVGVPRLAGVEHPLGKPFGDVGDADGQREVLRATLALLETLDAPGRVDLPHRWPDGKRARANPPKMPPIVTHLATHPWHLKNFIRREIPGS